MAATKRAPITQKPKYKAIEAKRYAEYQAAQAALGTAVARLKAAEKKVDPKLQALQVSRGSAVGTLTAARAVYEKVTGGVPVDADPRVAGLIVEKKTAEAALATARVTVRTTGAAVTGAARITAFVAKNNGKLLMVDESRFGGRLAASAAGTKGTIVVRGRWLGEPREVKLAGSLADVKHLAALLWTQLKRSL